MVEQGFRYDLESDRGQGPDDEKEEEPKPSVPAMFKLPAIRPLTFGIWMYPGPVNNANAEVKTTSGADDEQGPLSSFSKRLSKRFGQ